jgi:hypothetical protein
MKVENIQIMNESERDEFYFEIQDEAIRETLKELPYIMQVFHNPLYDLNETVGSDIDFMLGAVFGQILSHSSWLSYVRRASRPTPEQHIKINSRLFSKAPEFRTKILEIVRS